MKIIVGLGNPEDKYVATRHNFGFHVLEELRKKLGLSEWILEKRFKSEVIKAQYEVSGSMLEVILVRPQTYMNQSGLAISTVRSFYKVASEDIIIVHDELDLLLGHLKVRLGGGTGGHHGVENIIEKLGTDQFIRVRLGIGNDKSFSGEHKRVSFNAERFVLEPFLPNESSKVRSTTKKAIRAIETILDKGIDKAQNQFN